MESQSRIELGLMEGYSRWARTYDTKWNTLIATEELYSLDLLDSLEGETALDVGAGTGRFALKLARRGWKVTAVDANPDMLGIAERAAAGQGLALECSLAAIEDGLAVELGTFDLVVCALTLCHVPDLRGAIREFHRVLAPRGVLLITDVHPDFVAAGMPTQFDENGVTYQLRNEPHSRDDYLHSVADAGFDILTILDIPGREVPGGFVSPYLRQNFGDVNFALVVLCRRR